MTGRLLQRIVLLGCVLCVGLAIEPHSTYAQSPSSAPIAAVFRDGLDALEKGRAEEAIEHLERVLEEDSDYFETSEGTAAYWLGLAYLQQNDAESTLEVWEEGLGELAEIGAFDIRLADAFIEHVFEHRNVSRYNRAADVYLNLLASAKAALSAQEGSLLKKHLVPVAVVMPPALRKRVGLAALTERDDFSSLTPESGTMMVRWWRSQDVLPATPENERLEEHLQRVIYARDRYSREDDPLRVDERGEIYLRLGAPSRSNPITFEGTDFSTKVLNRSPTLSLSSFPAAEMWVYDQVDRDAQYVFIRKKGWGYQIGESSDIIPTTLRTGLGPSDRGRQKGMVLSRVMEEVYRQLAHLHTSYAPRYTDLAGYNELLDGIEFELRTQRESAQVNITSTAAQEVGDPALEIFKAQMQLPPHVYTQNILMQGQSEDLVAMRKREEVVPTTFSNVYGEAEQLPVAFRWARFLDTDGTTRTEVYWSASAEGLRPSEDRVKQLYKQGTSPGSDYLMNVTLVQQTADFVNRVINVERELLPATETRADAVLPAQTLVARGDTATYHLAIEWDQYWATVQGEAAQVKPQARLKIGSYRVDTLQTLSNTESVLEMSDLKPLVLDAETAPLEEALAYPHRRISPDQHIGLYFEVYHLNYDADDRTRYTVAYELARKTDGGLFRKDKQDRTATGTEYTGNSRTTEEYILLDLAEWQGNGTLDVTVRITDEVTGQQVERLLSFDLIEQ